MFINIKIISGRECTIEVTKKTSIFSVKEIVERELEIPVNQQRLVFNGRTLSDKMSLNDYDIVDGNKLHLFVSESIACGSSSQSPNQKSQQLWDHLRKFLRKDYAPNDVEKIIDEFRRNMSTQVNDLSLDDIERLAKFKLNVT